MELQWAILKGMYILYILQGTALKLGRLFMDKKQAGEILKCHERSELKTGCHRALIHSSRRKFKKLSTNSEEKHTDTKRKKKRKMCFVYQ